MIKATCTPFGWSTQKYSHTHMHSIWLFTQKYSRTHMHSIWLTNTKAQPYPHALHLTDQHKRTATPTCTPFDWSAQKCRRTHMHSVWLISTEVQTHPHALHLIDQHRSADAPTCTPFEWSAQKCRRTHKHSVWVISTEVQTHPQALRLSDQHKSTDAPTSTPTQTGYLLQAIMHIHRHCISNGTASPFILQACPIACKTKIPVGVGPSDPMNVNCPSASEQRSGGGIGFKTKKIRFCRSKLSLIME